MHGNGARILLSLLISLALAFGPLRSGLAMSMPASAGLHAAASAGKHATHCQPEQPAPAHAQNDGCCVFGCIKLAPVLPVVAAMLPIRITLQPIPRHLRLNERQVPPNPPPPRIA
jgi:hypothetical protein